mmetsp:Transcript_58726/g.134712  ORF Transcript_58726/g.134712 Transcript_58726/m.134712 type:complete len:242 (+) Transcript_58726:473-1198(+)
MMATRLLTPSRLPTPSPTPSRLPTPSRAFSPPPHQRPRGPTQHPPRAVVSARTKRSTGAIEHCRFGGMRRVGGNLRNLGGLSLLPSEGRLRNLRSLRGLALRGGCACAAAVQSCCSARCCQWGESCHAGSSSARRNLRLLRGRALRAQRQVELWDLLEVEEERALLDLDRPVLSPRRVRVLPRVEQRRVAHSAAGKQLAQSPLGALVAGEARRPAHSMLVLLLAAAVEDDTPSTPDARKKA